ncbi:CaiB/BaiF CoA transferase family protein [Brevibacillus brevis]|uniref:CaiB/BaiF CoA transferase family protein n=1 Tax=Brevibacillus brevis TaxID=1393 RepID=UPI0037BE37BF
MTLLKNLKILDFSTLLPGPYASLILADLGADVLRIEAPNRPDMARMVPPLDGDTSVLHQYVNRSKRSLALDLKKPEAVQIVKRLIQQYDIVLEQFRPGVMDRLGLGYEELKKVNPQIIYCSLTGYGQTGPYRDRAGHDINYLSIAGAANYTGPKEVGPKSPGLQVADLAGGSLYSVIGILAAVLHRNELGEGQAIDISMSDSTFALNAANGAGFLAGGVEPERESLLLNGGTFYNYYETKDGRFFSVGSIEPKFKKQLCEGIGRPELFSIGMSEDPEDVFTFKEAVREAFLSKTFDEWLSIFSDLDACVEPVLKFSEACMHPHIQERELIVEVPKPDGTSQKQLANPLKFTSFQPEYKYIGRELGADTTQVLKELGMSDKEIEQLQEIGIFGTPMS